MATSNKAAADNAAQDEAENVDAVRQAPTVAEGVGTEPAKGYRAYVSDRNLAEVNAGVVVYLNEKDEVGARLLATGYFTEVDDPQA